MAEFQRDPTEPAVQRQPSAEMGDKELQLALAFRASEAESYGRMQMVHDEELERVLAQSLREHRLEPSGSAIEDYRGADAGTDHADLNEPPVYSRSTDNGGTANLEAKELYNYSPLGGFPVTQPYTYGTLEPNEIRIFWIQMSDKIEDEIVGLLETVTLNRENLVKIKKQYTYVKPIGKRVTWTTWPTTSPKIDRVRSRHGFIRAHSDRRFCLGCCLIVATWSSFYFCLALIIIETFC